MHSDTPHQDSPQDLARRIENLARLGTVAEVRRSAPARCRVQLGENLTDWLPWFATRAAADQGSAWWPPVVGEQCLVLAPGGDLGQGVALLGLYSDRMPAPSDGEAVQRTQWSAEDFAEYREAKHTTHTEAEILLEVGQNTRARLSPEAIVLEVGSGCTIRMDGQAITLEAGGAELRIGAGLITSTVDMQAMGISATTHRHTGVIPGGAVSQGPI